MAFSFVCPAIFLIISIQLCRAEALESCANAPVTVHEENQSELIDLCGKYSNGSWLTVRNGNHTVYALCKDTSHSRATAYFSAHTLNASPPNDTVNAGDNDHMRRTTIAPSAENDSALPLLFLTSPIDFPDAQMDLFTKDANRVFYDFEETKKSWIAIREAVRRYAEQVKVELDIVSLMRVATVRQTEFFNGRTIVIDDFYATFVKLVMNDSSREGFAFMVPDTEESYVRQSISLIFAAEPTAMIDGAFGELPDNVIRCTFTDLYAFIDKYFIHHNKQ